jgi:hypothetical protein
VQAQSQFKVSVPELGMWLMQEWLNRLMDVDLRKSLPSGSSSVGWYRLTFWIAHSQRWD